MYKHIQLLGLGALPARTLEDLGHIVVVCGKNNSGKTTLLSAIKNGSQYLKTDELDVKKMISCVLMPDGSQWMHAQQLIEPILKSKDVWTENDADEFVRLVSNAYNHWQIIGIKPKNFFPDLKNTYREELKRCNAAFIPPKRLIELNGSILTSQPLTFEGRGLLNSLFYALNQFEETMDRKNYEEVKRLFQSVSGG